MSSIEAMTSFKRSIHLLYVPTLACNLGCRYCYLGGQTWSADLAQDSRRAVDTLQRALSAFIAAGVLPFNVSLHGGEVTVLPETVLDGLFSVIQQHYQTYFDQLNALGHRKSTPHIKTNLFNFHKIHDLLLQHKVSISGSIDLPLSLHGDYRRGRNGMSWLDQTVENLKLLGRYPQRKKISATFYQEHLHDLTAIRDDIWHIHRQLGFDMNNFNIMFGFESALNRENNISSGALNLKQASGDEQVGLYRYLKGEFADSELGDGFRQNWFDEFTPSYCTNSINCGERFFLLQGDGSVWSCVRGQGLVQFCYGNILSDSVEQIMDNARMRILAAQQRHGFDPQCRECPWLHICHSGCPVVKEQRGSGRSYTCELQKAIYMDNPASYPQQGDIERASRGYMLDVHPHLVTAEAPQPLQPQQAAQIPDELLQSKNALQQLIAAGRELQALYSGSAFELQINDTRIGLQSQILSPARTLHTVSKSDRIRLRIRAALFQANCTELLRNTLYIQLLRDTRVVYGDEQRSKQEHVFTHQIFHNHLQSDGDFMTVDLTALLQMYRGSYLPGVLNNLFFTTSYLRDYHYLKQKSNAFYHIQAVNLPFQNFEFYWSDL